MGDDDVVGVALDALEPDDVEDAFAQRLVALAGAVLEDGRTARRDEDALQFAEAPLIRDFSILFIS